jgi:CheY-like chemotaxis protein
MEAHVVERAFEPFFTTKEVGKGTGLGLSMVYGVARQSGGTARIHSKPGEGTCISLSFRRAPEGSVGLLEETQIQSTERTSASGSILIIDDDPDVRDFVATTLEELGYDVREANDGDEGLSEFRKHPPDLVILDFVMPGRTGADVAQEIRRERADQPILFVSGYSETDAIQRVSPGAPLLAKPFRADALDQAVRSAMLPDQ